MDTSFILSLIDKFNEGPITELDFYDGVNHLTLKKSPVKFAGTHEEPGHVLPKLKERVETPKYGEEPEPEPVVYPHSGIEELELPSGPDSLRTVTSPIVATFYASSAPDLPPFVRVGTKVKAGETLCVLEAMKMMNKLPADFDMEIVSVEVENGDLVEFEQVLFKVKEL